MQSRSANNASGIDVSHYQGSIDWNKVKASGITFAFIKASEGKSYRDKRFIDNVEGSSTAGLLIGPYHFLNAQTQEDARLEARNFAAAIQSAGGIMRFTLPLVMDYENNPGGLSPEQITKVALVFLQEIERLTSRRPIIYTGNSFAANFSSALSSYKLWIARYSSKVPSDVPAWKRWHFWQYSSKGSVPGIKGNVDMNEFSGTSQDLKSEFGDKREVDPMPNPNPNNEQTVRPPGSQPQQQPPAWKQNGRQWLIDHAGISETWKSEDPVDIGTLGTILARLYNK